MAIKKTFNGAAIFKPGAYSKIVVENLTGFPLQDSGTVAIVGEAIGGEPRVLDIVSKEQIQSAKARYKSGPIADALELLVSPSRDPRIANGASKIVIYKTNGGTRSALSLLNDATVPANMLQLRSKNWGADENQLSVLVSQGTIVDRDARIEGTIAAPFAVADTDTLILNVNGTNYTFTCSLNLPAATVAQVEADLNNVANWAPSKPVIAAAVGQSINLAIDPAIAKKDYSFIKVDMTSTLDTILGLAGENRGRKGSRIFSFKKDLVEEVLPEVGGLSVLSIKYVGAGTAASMTIQKTLGELRLQTTCVGAAADDLDIMLVNAEGKNFYTIQSLVDLIGSNPAYEVSVLNSSGSINASQLDFYNAVRIDHVALSVSRDLWLFDDSINFLSQFAECDIVDNAVGALEVYPIPKFFLGASDGTSANINFINGFEAFKEERINCVVPLISKDIGSLTVDSINASAADHGAWSWSTTGKSERHIFASKLGNKEALKDAARALNSGYVCMVGQQVQVRDRLGDFVWLDPWGMACVLAGMRAGAEVGEPLTAKFINVNGARVLDGSWNPRRDFNEMIDAGVTFVEPVDSGGFRVVVGNTTYGIDPSFVWNRESVVQAAGYVAYDLRFNLELTFTGNKARTGTAEAMANFIKARMSQYLEADIIVGDDDNEGLGYKNLRVSIQGNTALINISVTPVQGIDFILPTIYLADIRQSA
jgi:hypothetical protein